MTELDIPGSNATVRVRMVDTSAIMVVNARSFIEPVQGGHDFLNLYVAAFLLEHQSSGKKVMFDLGVRKEYWKLPAALQKRLGFVIPALRVDKDTTEILQDNGIGLDEIFWSHYHWDHTGSMELFPSTAELIVGPGFKASPNLLPGFPEQSDSPIDSAAVKGRLVTEIEFSDSGLSIGGFRAHDFFGDGSFYLLDTPGHCIGHMCGLARTTGGANSTFVLLGGDICHFPGVLRPNSDLPLPDSIPKKCLDQTDYFPTPCPCSFFTDEQPVKSGVEPRETPFYNISTHETAAYIDPAISQASVNKLLKFDSSPSVLVCLAHDEAMLRNLPTINEQPNDNLNDWKRRGFKELIHWSWLNHLPRKGKPGRARALEGFWRDGKLWSEAQEVLRRNGERASKIGL